MVRVHGYNLITSRANVRAIECARVLVAVVAVVVCKYAHAPSSPDVARISELVKLQQQAAGLVPLETIECLQCEAGTMDRLSFRCSKLTGWIDIKMPNGITESPTRIRHHAAQPYSLRVLPRTSIYSERPSAETPGARPT